MLGGSGVVTQLQAGRSAETESNYSADSGNSYSALQRRR